MRLSLSQAYQLTNRYFSIKSLFCYASISLVILPLKVSKAIGIAPIIQLRMCVIKIVTFKGDHLLCTVACLTADPGVESLIPAWSDTFMEIGHEIISIVILLPYAE